MDALVIGVAVIVLTVATGAFLTAVWRHMWRPAVAGQPRLRRVAIAACCAMPAVGAIALALLDLSDSEAFFTLAAITFSSLGLGIWISLRRAS